MGRAYYFLPLWSDIISFPRNVLIQGIEIISCTFWNKFSPNRPEKALAFSRDLSHRWGVKTESEGIWMLMAGSCSSFTISYSNSPIRNKIPLICRTAHHSRSLKGYLMNLITLCSRIQLQDEIQKEVIEYSQTSRSPFPVKSVLAGYLPAFFYKSGKTAHGIKIDGFI